jgi:zinc transport system ATP-binding protein
MKQKLMAAMALATEAPILVCDEPTANLDGDARSAFFAELADRPARGIVVLCSHRSEEIAELVDRVVELRDGRIAYDGPPVSLRPASERHPSHSRLMVAQ